jgi:hypothetical protein
MLSKIFNILKKRLKQKEPEEEEEEVLTTEEGTFLDNPCAHLLIEVDEEGDFVVGFDATTTTLEAVSSIGNLIFLINSGSLSAFFVKSLQLWTEEVEGEEREERETFVTLIFAQWNETHTEHEGMLEKLQETQQNTASQSAVDPSRVFNLRKYL